MSLSYKKRIALRFIIATGIIVMLAFVVIFFTVKQSVYNNLDKSLTHEAYKHLEEVEITKDTIRFINKAEWEESEHREVEVNPVFIQITDSLGRVMDKSPNLKEDSLILVVNQGDIVNSKLKSKAIRQIQVPLKNKEHIVGYIIAAMDLTSSLLVIEKLKIKLITLFPIVIIILFFISSYLAGKSISPVVSIINTANSIDKKNIEERISYPGNKDVLYKLTEAINSLLDRIEEALKREQQFTADASHELRTPLSVLKGTLEVLIRKPRTQEEYEKQIKQSLIEVNRISDIIDQLLTIARFDSGANQVEVRKKKILKLIDDIIERNKDRIVAKQISIKIKQNNINEEVVDDLYANLIIENIIDNAIKYSQNNSEIIIRIWKSEDKLNCKVTDFGIGIKQEDINKIFDPFFRSEALSHKQIKGSGLGLSIAYRAAQFIGADIKVISQKNKETSFIVSFPHKFDEILRRF